MRKFKLFYFFFIVGFIVISCQKDGPEPVQDLNFTFHEFEVPVVPDEIAVFMSDEDLSKFKAGPGEAYLQMQEQSNARRAGRHWYPVLMKLGYHLQIGPIGGISCQPGEYQYCITSEGTDSDCLSAVVGAAGKTVADGNWFSKSVHSEYYPVFCLPDYSGYGSGFYKLENGTLWLEAENGPFQYDDEGNSTFCRKGHYMPEQSEGVFSGATGWEVMISYTSAENNPSNSPDGMGYSDVIIFGWVYR